MKLKKLEVHQETLSKLTQKKAPNQKTGNPDCTFVITCPHPCHGDANLRNRDVNPRNR